MARQAPWFGMVGLGSARIGGVGCGVVWQGVHRGKAWSGAAGQGRARHGKQRGEARLGRVRHG